MHFYKFIYNLKTSPYVITLWMIAILLIPRFLTEYAFQMGTVCILLFWIAMLVLLPDYVEEFDIKNQSIKNIPKLILIIISIFLILNIPIYFFFASIYDKESSFLFSQVRRILYLFSPMICLMWIPLIVRSERYKFCLIVSSLTFGIYAVLLIPVIIDGSSVGYFLNDKTCRVSSCLLQLIYDYSVYSRVNIIYLKNYSLEISSTCGSPPQILLSMYALYICYVTCKIQSLMRFFLVITLSISVAFFSNALRISILGWCLSEKGMDSFEFWHDGFGSFLFTFIVMTLTCTVYYYFWNKENTLAQ